MSTKKPTPAGKSPPPKAPTESKSPANPNPPPLSSKEPPPTSNHPPNPPPNPSSTLPPPSGLSPKREKIQFNKSSIDKIHSPKKEVLVLIPIKPDEYFANLLKDNEISHLVSKVTSSISLRLNSNQLFLSEAPLSVQSLLEKAKTNLLEVQIRKQKVKEASEMKSQLSKKLLTVEMELELLKAKDFGSPKLKKPEHKDKITITPSFDFFIKKTISERKSLERRRQAHISQMLTQMHQHESDLALIEKQKQESQNLQKLSKIRNHIDTIKMRMDSRSQETKQWKETLKSLYKQAPKPEEDFKRKEEEVYKKTAEVKLEELRKRAKPIDVGGLKEHEEKYLEGRTKKREEKEKEMKEKGRNERVKKPEHMSEFYRKADEELAAKGKQEEERKKREEERRKKMEELESLRKERYLPKIDEEKREQLEKDYEKLTHKKIKRLKKKKDKNESNAEAEDDDNAFDPLNYEYDPRKKGLEYLEEVRKLKKPIKSSRSVDNLSSKQKDGDTSILPKDKSVKAIDYMKDERVRKILTKKKNELKQLESLLKDTNVSENLKRDQVKAQAEYWEEKARIKEQARKIKKPYDSAKVDVNDEIEEINELYLNSVKAKLALFNENKKGS